MTRNPRNHGGKPDARRIVSEARRERDRRAQSYRDRALRLFPPVCARCGREFSGKRLRELTVHHRDHDHDHNPPDGSNWELLCIYCHENEHARQAVADAYAPTSDAERTPSGEGNRPFADLADLLRRKSEP